MAITLQTRPINQEEDWFLYNARYPLDESDRKHLYALSRDSAAAFWKDVIAHRWKPLPRFLPASHWANQPTAHGPDWYALWNTPAEPDPIAAFLRRGIPWTDDCPVFVVLDGDTTYQTTWSVFISGWKTFLFNNEDVIVVTIKDPGFVRFVDSGVLFTGKRELTATLDVPP